MTSISTDPRATRQIRAFTWASVHALSALRQISPQADRRRVVSGRRVVSPRTSKSKIVADELFRTSKSIDQEKTLRLQSSVLSATRLLVTAALRQISPPADELLVVDEQFRTSMSKIAAKLSLQCCACTGLYSRTKEFFFQGPETVYYTWHQYHHHDTSYAIHSFQHVINAFEPAVWPALVSSCCFYCFQHAVYISIFNMPYIYRFSTCRISINFQHAVYLSIFNMPYTYQLSTCRIPILTCRIFNMPFKPILTCRLFIFDSKHAVLETWKISCGRI